MDGAGIIHGTGMWGSVAALWVVGPSSGFPYVAPWYNAAFLSVPALEEGGPIMWLKEPAKLNDTIDYLGTHQLCFYLVRGEDALIVGGGMNHATPAVDAQLDALDIDPARVKYAVMTHSHFDHCGAMPYFRRRFPGVQVLGTSAAQQALSKQKVVDYNAKMNDLATEQAGLGARCLCLADRTSELAVDRVVSDGEVLDLGNGVTVEFYEVPGHSRCCLATYVPCCKALFPTDTTPYPVHEWTDLAFPSAQYDFASYVASLQRLNEFDVDIVGLDHHGVLLGAQAGEFLRRGLDRTLAFQERVLRMYAESNDLDSVSRDITREALPTVQLPFITEDLLFVITRAMIKSIVGV